ncbi:hypothetical protein X777_08533 [Ooceraea biroi]|uniref:Uncharacterized protein n=1 Tax=Ooceraea biroi TaxID=2015173 RepID=A0A026W8Z3_OOCBI|nr:hypothetical protein X777_08533 [Ooceraea biroi]
MRWPALKRVRLIEMHKGYLTFEVLDRKHEEFINRPPKHQLLEEVITFIIQWFHPEKNVSCSHIDMDLDNIAQQVMKHLKVENPKHPIFSASREQFSSNVTNSNDEHCFYIYLKEGKDGAILNKNNLPRINNFALECPISFDRYPRITLVEDELRATCYASRHIDLIQQRTTDMLSEYKSRYDAPSTKHIKYVLKPKQRVAEMKFAVGMIVKLKGTNTMWQDIPLVIIGWTEIDDLELRAKNQSVWIPLVSFEEVFQTRDYDFGNSYINLEEFCQTTINIKWKIKHIYHAEGVDKSLKSKKEGSHYFL